METSEQEPKDRFKNYKTSFAFLNFIICYNYAIYIENVDLAWLTGFLCLVTWILLKSSNETFKHATLLVLEAFRDRVGRKKEE